MAVITPSPAFGALIPSQTQTPNPGSYLTFDSASGGGTFAKQYLPEIYEQEVERYGNRTLSGFLRMVGAEMPMQSDQVIWSEQNRLHVAYKNVTIVSATTFKFTVGSVTDGNVTATVTNVLSKNQTVVIINPATGREVKAIITAVGAVVSNEVTITVAPYLSASIVTGSDGTNGIPLTTASCRVFVYGSEYAKGSTLTNDSYLSIDPSFTQFNNSPIIIRNKYTINGSDMAQIGWVEVATEAGASGFLWYLKAESETRLRFEDYLEMAVIEGEIASTTPGAAGDTTNKKKGTEGLFASVKKRGNTVAAFGGTAAENLTSFDNILKNLDTQGAIEENMLFLNRATSLEIDTMLAGQNSYGSGGTSFGVFENSEQMSLNLGFTGFRRGSYDFYKTDWKYLNDASTRGGLASVGGNIDGVLVPAGTSTVYDQQLGTNIRRPFLHVRYRASQADDRKMKTWVLGSAGGAYTSDTDAMEVHFLSERCLCVQGANNFVLFTAV